MENECLPIAVVELFCFLRDGGTNRDRVTGKRILQEMLVELKNPENQEENPENH